jgi:hypothetical protein
VSLKATLRRQVLDRGNPPEAALVGTSRAASRETRHAVACAVLSAPTMGSEYLWHHHARILSGAPVQMVYLRSLDKGRDSRPMIEPGSRLSFIVCPP